MFFGVVSVTAIEHTFTIHVHTPRTSATSEMILLHSISSKCRWTSAPFLLGIFFVFCISFFYWYFSLLLLFMRRTADGPKRPIQTHARTHKAILSLLLPIILLFYDSYSWFVFLCLVASALQRKRERLCVAQQRHIDDDTMVVMVMAIKTTIHMHVFIPCNALCFQCPSCGRCQTRFDRIEHVKMKNGIFRWKSVAVVAYRGGRTAATKQQHNKRIFFFVLRFSAQCPCILFWSSLVSLLSRTSVHSPTPVEWELVREAVQSVSWCEVTPDQWQREREREPVKEERLR